MKGFEKKFTKAMEHLNNKDDEEAVKILEKLYTQEREPARRTRVVDALITTLDTLEHYNRLLDLTDEGQELAHKIKRPALQAHFAARKAHFLDARRNMMFMRIKEIKLVPTWYGFATESQKRECDSLEESIRQITEEIGALLRNAAAQFDATSDARAYAALRITEGNILAGQYLIEAAKGFRRGLALKAWLRFPRLRHFHWFQRLAYRQESLRRMRKIIRHMTKVFKEAIRAQEHIGAGVGEANYEFANNLTTAYEFRLARRYLRVARKIGEKEDNTRLLKHIEMLDSRIKTHNKNVPDYVGGER